MIPLIGYTNKLSARPGETLEVKVSSTASTPYRAELMRIICGDPNPEGPGIQTEPVAAGFENDYPSRPQTNTLGSHMRAALSGPLPGHITISAILWPTTTEKGRQGVVSLVDIDNTAVISLGIGAGGAEITGPSFQLAIEKHLRPRAWYRIWAEINTVSGTVQVGQTLLSEPSLADEDGMATGDMTDGTKLDNHRGILVGAVDEGDPATHFNGKIEAPAIFTGAMSIDDWAGSPPLAAWNFSCDMHSFTIPADGPLGTPGTLVGAPARAMTGSNWDASEMNWQRAPEQYGAIHFHDDDIADAGWKTDFDATIPEDLPSGIYAIKLTQGDNWDMLPVFVCPPTGTQTADVCVVVPTFTYVIYANQGRVDVTPRWYRSEEHTSELQSLAYLVCRLLLEKKK